MASPASASVKAQETVTVVAAGDIAPNPGSCRDGDVATSRLVLDLDPTAVLTLGDHQYPRGELADFRSRSGYAGSWGRFKARTRPSPGNHDYTDPAGHRDDTRTQYFWNALYAARADLVLAGHNHAYERFGPLHPLGQLVDDGAGIRAFVVGTGGNGLYPFLTPPRPGSRYRDDGHHGILRLTLGPTWWSSAFHRTDGQVVDPATAGCWP